MPETTDLDGSSVISVIALSRMGVERNQFGCLPTQAKIRLEWATQHPFISGVPSGLNSEVFKGPGYALKGGP
jgi:hypothetical protein